MSTDKASSDTRALFARRLKALRVPKGFPTARSFASALEIDENRYTRYERAEVEPDLGLLVKICQLLYITPNDLLDAETGPDANGFAEPSAPPYAPVAEAAATPAKAGHGGNGPNPSDLKRAFAWEIAEAVVKLDKPHPDLPFERMSRVSKLYAEIDADPFSFVSSLSRDPRISGLDSETSARIAGLAESLISCAKASLLGRTTHG